MVLDLLWQWHVRLDVILVLAALGGLYVRGWRRTRRRGHRGLAPRWRLLAYLTGLASLALALLSPLDHLAEVLFTAHMVQHQMLIMVAPPLLLLGNPFPLILWGLPGRLRYSVGGALTRSSRLRATWRFLTWMPVAGVLYTASLWGWHLPAAYEAALHGRVVHDLEHLTFFGTAVLFWWPVVNPAPRLHRLTTGLQYGCRIAYLILATGLNTLLGAVLGLAEHVLYPSYAAAPPLFDWSALDDQAFGGGVMWSGGHMFLVAILVLVARAMDAEERRAAVGPGALQPAERAAGSAEKGGARPPSIV